VVWLRRNVETEELRLEINVPKTTEKANEPVNLDHQVGQNFGNARKQREEAMTSVELGLDETHSELL